MIQKNANLAQFRSGQVPHSYFEMSASPSSSCSLFFCQLALLLLLQWVCRVKIVQTPAPPSLSWRVAPTRSCSRWRTKHHEGGVCWRWKAHGKAATDPQKIEASYFVNWNSFFLFLNIEFIKWCLHIYNRWILQLTESKSVWITNSPVRLIKCNPVSYILITVSWCYIFTKAKECKCRFGSYRGVVVLKASRAKSSSAEFLVLRIFAKDQKARRQSLLWLDDI